MDKILIWCNLNIEQDLLAKKLGKNCVSIQGSTPNDEKIRLEKLWREGDVPILISKPVCFGYGMNWQHCNKMIFVGLSDSFEQYFQAVRRCWRFGQKKEVDVHIITADLEGAVKENIARKERESEIMYAEMVKYTKDITTRELHQTKRETTEYNPQIEMLVPKWIGEKNNASY